jgi:hypothetical protein
MHKVTIAAVTIALGALVATVSANAERYWGPTNAPGPNGQCWKPQVGHTGGANAGTWGYWEACPQKASATVAATPRRKAHRASR